MKRRLLKITIPILIAVTMLLSSGVLVASARNDASNPNPGELQVSTLNEEEINSLVYMREEEKLARDVYLNLYYMWQLPIFQNIAISEQRHTDAIENLLEKYGIEDPVIDEEIKAGFTNEELEAMYQELIEKGGISLTDAIEVGVMIEETDISDLEEALNLTDHNDIERVYNNLLRGSNNHLTAFISHLE